MLDIPLQKIRNTNAAKRLFRKLLKGLRFVPRKADSGKLGSYSAARNESMPPVKPARDKVSIYKAFGFCYFWRGHRQRLSCFA